MNVRSLSLVLALAVASPLAAAPTPEQRKAARGHYEKAVNHFNLGEYGDAAEEFRQVYKISPQPVILYDAAQAYRLANQPEQALTLYESFLREAPNAPVRGEVERRIAELRGKRDARPRVEVAKGEGGEAKPDTKSEAKSTEPATKPEPTAKVEPTKVAEPTKPVAKPEPAAPRPRENVVPDGNGSERLKPVADIIKKNRAGFRACYDKWSAAHPGVPGKVKLTFYLDPDGNLDQAEADLTGFEAPEVPACIEEYAGTLKYPASAGGKFTRFVYPFDFKPAR